LLGIFLKSLKAAFTGTPGAPEKKRKRKKEKESDFVKRSV
jgi:hypothetical protein